MSERHVISWPLSRQRMLAYGLIAVVALGMAAWSFGRWPDPLVDFGKEPYVAWRLSEGQRLYSELAHFNGPLSPYVNALLFWSWGPSLGVLWAFNALVAVLICGLIVRQLERIAGLWGATAAGLVFVTLFVFAQLTPIGNYNYLSPITHELTHGLLLALLQITCLGAAAGGERAWLPRLGVGLCLGLLFLTRAELFVAAAMSCMAGLLVEVRLSGLGPGAWVRRVSHVSAIAFGVVVVAAGLLTAHMPARAAIIGTLGTWPTLLRGEVSALPFYRHGLGIDTPGLSVLKLLAWSALYAVWLGAAYLVARRVRSPRLQPVLALGLLLLPWAAWAWLGSPALLRDVARPLPLVVLVLAYRHWRSPLTAADRAAPVMLAAWLGLAFGMLFKILLYARVHHYGFAHAMPAALLAVVGLVCWLPAHVARQDGSATLMRAAGSGLILTLVAAFLTVQARLWAAREHPIGRGADQLLADARGPFVAGLLAELRATEPAATLAVYPEGALVNFLARRINPTPFPSLMPTELTAFGESRVLDALHAHAPDYVALVQRDTSEFGRRFFGQDYAVQIGAFLRARYEPVQQLGALPLHDERFGILLLRRRDLHARGP